MRENAPPDTSSTKSLCHFCFQKWHRLFPCPVWGTTPKNGLVPFVPLFFRLMCVCVWACVCVYRKFKFGGTNGTNTAHGPDSLGNTGFLGVPYFLRDLSLYMAHHPFEPRKKPANPTMCWRFRAVPYFCLEKWHKWHNRSPAFRLCGPSSTTGQPLIRTRTTEPCRASRAGSARSPHGRAQRAMRARGHGWLRVPPHPPLPHASAPHTP